MINQNLYYSTSHKFQVCCFVVRPSNNTGVTFKEIIEATAQLPGSNNRETLKAQRIWQVHSHFTSYEWIAVRLLVKKGLIIWKYLAHISCQGKIVCLLMSISRPEKFFPCMSLSYYEISLPHLIPYSFSSFKFYWLPHKTIEVGQTRTWKHFWCSNFQSCTRTNLSVVYIRS